MVSINALYDGTRIISNNIPNIKIPQKVIITFLEENDDEITSEMLSRYAEQGGAFDFLDNSEDDIYSDNDLKIKY